MEIVGNTLTDVQMDAIERLRVRETVPFCTLTLDMPHTYPGDATVTDRGESLRVWGQWIVTSEGRIIEAYSRKDVTDQYA